MRQRRVLSGPRLWATVGLLSLVLLLAVFSFMKILSPLAHSGTSRGLQCMAVSRDDASRVPVDLPQFEDEIASVVGRTLPVRTYQASGK